MFFHLGKFRFWGEFSFVSKFQHFELFHFGIFGFDTQCLSNMSPIALFYVMDFACVPLASFGFSFLVVVFCEGRGATLLGVDCSFSKTSKNVELFKNGKSWQNWEILLWVWVWVYLLLIFKVRWKFNTR